jgi:hypothetical protein
VCACGEFSCPAEGGGFYVTCVDGPRVGYLLGPYQTHEAALDEVELGRRLAERVNARACWWGFGTVRYRGPGFLPAAKLNDLADGERARMADVLPPIERLLPKRRRARAG